MEENEKKFGDALYERMYGVGLSLEARDDLPENAQEFANAVYRAVSDSLSGALQKAGKSSREIEDVFALLSEALINLNNHQGRHPDDKRPNDQTRI
ncbi:MAG: hypothetical protein M0T78_10860 [Actinomycetota bacterium]|nr:hypothetical protein [Actinomycetota bacterium]